MRNTFLLCLALGGLAPPLAAQTASSPTPRQLEEAANRERASKDAAAQAALANKLTAVNEFGSNGYDVVAFDSRMRLMRGSPYVVAGWAKGDVLLGTSLKPTPGMFKFDSYNQHLRALRPQGDSIILASERVQAFTLRPIGKDGKAMERHFERLPNELIATMPTAFAEDISGGVQLRLLKFQHKTIVKGQADTSYSSTNPVDSFKSNERYYLRWADGTYVAVKPSKTSILDAVAAKQPAAAATEMQDKTKARTDAELSALVQRIDGSLGGK